jgi:mono/diheme cytochrome c family protein
MTMTSAFSDRISRLLQLVIVGLATASPAAELPPLPEPAARQVDFVRDIQPIFAKSCYACHSAQKQKSGLRLDVKTLALAGGDDGPVILPGRSAASMLIRNVAGLDPEKIMPAKGARLTAEQIGLLRAWIDQGAVWPESADAIKLPGPADWWSFKPIVRPAVPAADGKWGRTPIDALILARLKEKGLAPSPEADRRTLIRRVTYDLTGLPPSPQEIDEFLCDKSTGAYEKVVDRLLASPRYGERWARHWLDTVHYGDTHGYDKDKVRPNAWPYRDYVIRSFNEDKPYSRFVREQLAGDWFYPGTPDGILGLGFIAAGPFDFVGQIEVREGSLDKAITRNLDRDDMVSATMNTFVGLTVQCARCHNHKFDPIQQEDYYSLQAVFAAVDRADRPYETDPAVGQQRKDLKHQIDALAARTAEIQSRVPAAIAPQLAALDARIAQASKHTNAPERPEFGYHSAIARSPNETKWAQVDLGKPTPIQYVVLVGAHDNYNNIGAGFGFPVRFRIEASNDPQFKTVRRALPALSASKGPPSKRRRPATSASPRRNSRCAPTTSSSPLAK